MANMPKMVNLNPSLGTKPSISWPKNGKPLSKKIWQKIKACLPKKLPPQSACSALDNGQFGKVMLPPNSIKLVFVPTTSTPMRVTVWPRLWAASCVPLVQTNRWAAMMISNMQMLLYFGVPIWQKCTPFYGHV